MLKEKFTLGHRDREIAVLAHHAIRTLPEKLGERRRVLESVLSLITAAHPAYSSVRQTLAMVKDAEVMTERLHKMQATLPLKFQEAR